MTEQKFRHSNKTHSQSSESTQKIVITDFRSLSYFIYSATGSINVLLLPLHRHILFFRPKWFDDWSISINFRWFRKSSDCSEKNVIRSQNNSFLWHKTPTISQKYFKNISDIVQKKCKKTHRKIKTPVIRTKKLYSIKEKSKIAQAG